MKEDSKTKEETVAKSESNSRQIKLRETQSPSITIREHAEFHNCYTIESVQNDLKFLQVVYNKPLMISPDDVNLDLINKLKVIGRDIYFFLKTLEIDLNPQNYIKAKYDFIQHNIPNADPNLFYIAWNGMLKNDSFRRLLLHTFNLSRFTNILAPQSIAPPGSSLTRYRSKLVLADDMATNSDGSRRTTGRTLDDGSGLLMKESIIWLPNGKAMPLFPQAYVPLNQTHVLMIRHGKSIHESGGSNPEFVGSGLWDSWGNNRRISGSLSNYLSEEGIRTAQELGLDFKVAVDILDKAGYPIWSWSKETPVQVFGSESENTEQTARQFLQQSGYSNMHFHAIFGINSQKYGALTFKYKNEIIEETTKIYSKGGDTTEAKTAVSKMFKNRFYHYPEGETLIEADWRIAYSFIDILNKNLGKRILLSDHSGAIRVFEAVIRTLDFAEYSSIKEAQDSILAICYQPGLNLRYDYLQRKDFPLRKRDK